MAYQTGAPANTTNLITTFINWLVSDGGFTLANTWTFNASASNADSGTIGAAYTARALSRGGAYVTLAWKTTSPDFLYLNTSTNNPTTGRLNQQTNSSSNGSSLGSMRVELGTTPLRYHMFSDGNHSHCAVEWLGGVYQHINVGSLTKYGTWTGGLYVSGTYWDRIQSIVGNYTAWDDFNHVRPFDAKLSSSGGSYSHIRVNYLSQNVAHFGNNSIIGNAAFGLQLWDKKYTLDRSPNAYNGRALLVPIEVTLGLEDSTNPTYHIPLGRVENCAYINITNLNPGDTILTDWMVFPLSAKNSGGTTAAGYINSLNYGIAYRK